MSPGQSGQGTEIPGRADHEMRVRGAQFNNKYMSVYFDLVDIDILGRLHYLISFGVLSP